MKFAFFNYEPDLNGNGHNINERPVEELSQLLGLNGELVDLKTGTLSEFDIKGNRRILAFFYVEGKELKLVVMEKC